MGFSFTFHECDGSISERPVDREPSSLVEAQAIATELARTIMSEEVANGRLCLSCWIVVKNGMGHNVLTVQFGDVLKMVDHTECRNHPANAPRSAPQA